MLLVVASAALLAIAAPALADQVAPAQTWVTDGPVSSVVPGANGVAYIAGGFSQVAPATGSFASFDAATGAEETGWPDVVGTIYAMAPDGSGGWYIGGSLTSVGGLPRQNLAHILPDKSVDSAWAPSTDGVVRTLAVGGSSVYVGGDFGQVDGQARGTLGAVAATTGALTAFDPEVSGTSASGNSVDSIALVGTTLYTAGVFTAVGADARVDLAAIDTTTSLATSWAPDPNGYVAALASNGSTLYVAGGFSSIAGATRAGLAAFDTATGTITAWAPPAASQFGGAAGPGYVHALAVAGTTVYLGGFFTMIGGLSRPSLAAVDATTGALTAWSPAISDTAVNTPTGCEFSDVESIVVTASTVYAGDACSDYALPPQTDLVALDRTTGAKTAFSGVVNAVPYALAVSGSHIVAGGDFTSAGPWSARDGLAAIDATGAATSWNPSVPGQISAVTVSGSKVYVASYSIVGFQTHSAVAVVDASTGAVSDLGLDVSGLVDSLSVAGGVVYMGGSFTSVSGQARANLASATIATGALTSWNPGTGASGSENGAVGTVVTAGTTVYVEGSFVSVGGVARTGLAAIDGTSGIPTAWNPQLTYAGQPTYPSTLVVSGTRVYVGGSFDTADGQPRVGVASFDAQTNTITSWNPQRQIGSSLFFASALLVGNGVAYLSGGNNTDQIGTLTAYDTATGQPTGWQIQVNPSGNIAEPFASISAFALVNDAIYVAGAFTHMNGQNASEFARFDVAGATGTATSPASESAPAIAGSPTVGASLACSTGTWSGDPLPTFGFQWLRDGAPIAGEVAISHLVTGDDAGHSLVCRVTATNSTGSVSADSPGVSVAAVVSPPGGGQTQVNPPPGPNPPGPHPPAGNDTSVKAAVAIIAKTLTKAGALQLKVTCPVTAKSACSGSFSVATAKAIKATKGAKAKTVVLGRATFHIAAGKSGKAQITLTKPGRQLLARLGSLSVRLTTTTSGAGVAAASVATKTFTLHAHK